MAPAGENSAFRPIAPKGPLVPPRPHTKSGRNHTGHRYQDQRVSAILDEYKTKMVNGNEKFLLDRINEIHARDLPTERDRLNLLARFWFHKHRWPIKGTDLCDIRHQSPRPWIDPEQIRREEGVNELNEVKALHHPYMNGLLPNTLRSMLAVMCVAQALYRVAIEYHTAAGRPYTDGRIPDFSPPAEMHYFLLKTDGLCDPDFRYANKCGWSLVDDIEKNNIDDRVAFENDAQNAFRAALVEPSQLPANVRGALDVITGVVTGRSTTENGRVGWQSFYLFCRYRTSQTSETSEIMPRPLSDFAWRFCFTPSPVERPAKDQPICPPRVFDDIQSLLTWFVGWVDSPGLNKRVASIYDEWDTDSDSAGEAESVAESMGVSHNTRRARKSEVAATSATVDVRPS